MTALLDAEIVDLLIEVKDELSSNRLFSFTYVLLASLRFTCRG
jgi:hypothetical protein